MHPACPPRALVPAIRGSGQHRQHHPALHPGPCRGRDRPGMALGFLTRSLGRGMPGISVDLEVLVVPFVGRERRSPGQQPSWTCTTNCPRKKQAVKNLWLHQGQLLTAYTDGFEVFARSCPRTSDRDW